MNVLHFLTAYVQTAFHMARIKRDERGVSALEYALIAALVGLAIVTTVTTYGTNLSLFFSKIGSKVATLGT